MISDDPLERLSSRERQRPPVMRIVSVRVPFHEARDPSDESALRSLAMVCRGFALFYFATQHRPIACKGQTGLLIPLMQQHFAARILQDGCDAFHSSHTG